MSGEHPDVSTAAGAVRALRTTAAIRERACHLLARARAGASDGFAIDDAAMAQAARTVAELTRQRFPDLRIPYHSRWRHFEAGQVNRPAQLDARLGPVDAAARARAQIDLALVSVLLDAGAGPHWRYREADSGLDFSRSEGLGVASFHAFTAGLFSSDPGQPLQVDAEGLRGLSTERLGQAFQAGPGNPLVGLEGRAALLRRLGEALQRHPSTYGPHGRPGGLYDALLKPGQADAAHAPGVQGPRHPRCLARHPVRHLARAERESTATPWAIAGAIPPCPARDGPPDGCPSTSCPSG